MLFVLSMFACVQRIKMTPDCQYIVAAGTYPPAVRVYDVQEMSMKFERRLTSEVRNFISWIVSF